MIIKTKPTQLILTLASATHEQRKESSKEKKEGFAQNLLSNPIELKEARKGRLCNKFPIMTYPRHNAILV